MNNNWFLKIGGFIKSHLLLVLMLIILFWTLSPALFLAFPDEGYVEASGVIAHFGNNSNRLKLTNAPLSFYFSQYGTHVLGNMIAYKLFEFNSFAYFALNISLRILAAVSIYYFVSKWGNSKIAGFIAGVIFGVSFPGIQNTTRVTLFMVYLAIFFMFIFLDKWWQFHSSPNFRSARSSTIFLILSILIYPVRMIGMAILLVTGEVYWNVSKYKDQIKRAVRIKHSVAVLVTLVLLILLTGTLQPTPEIQFKMVSPKILLLALFTGYPPVINSLWLFISNLIIPPALFKNGYLPYTLIHSYSNVLPLLGVIFMFACLKKRKFLLAFASIVAITFPIFFSISAIHLKDWKPSWIISTQFGGTIFLLATLTVFLMWNSKRRLAELGLLGIFIILSNLLVPWMISPVSYDDSQSLFDFSMRYYTLPSVGMGILLGSVFAFFITEVVNKVKNLFIDLTHRNLIQASLVFKINKIFNLASMLLFSFFLLAFPLIILATIYLQILLAHNSLFTGTRNIDASKIDLFWNELKYSFPISQNTDNSNIIYIQNDGNLNEKYIKNLFPLRFAIYLGQIVKPPPFKFIFDKDEALKSVKYIKNQPDTTLNFKAYRFDGKNILDITNEIFKLQ